MANQVREQPAFAAEDPEADGADRRQDREGRNGIHLQEERLPEHGNHCHRLQTRKLVYEERSIERPIGRLI